VGKEGFNMSVQWGFAGAGRIARRFLNGLTQVDDAVPYAVYGRTAAKAEALAHDYGFAHVCSSIEDLIDSGIDVAYVATTHPSHATFAKQFLDAGIPVLCEKPLTPNAATTKELIEYARAKDTFLMEAMWTRTFPVTRQLKTWLEDEALGRLAGMTGNFCIKPKVDFDDRMYNMDLAGGAMLDIGVYLLAFVELVFGGKPDEIKAVGTLAETGVDTNVSVALRYGDKIVSLFMTLGSESPDTVKIYGEKWMIEVADAFWRPRKATLTYLDGTITIESPEPPVPANTTVPAPRDFSFSGEGYQNEVKHVHECLEKGLRESPLMTLDSTLAIAEISDEIRRQLGVIYPFER
jgi:predicted dehydrogenase